MRSRSRGAALVPASPARPPLVGRRAERERLAELWRQADGGRAQLVLVTGEAAETGLAAADEALEMGGGTELWEAEIRRLRAEFLSGFGADPREIEAELRRAIDVAGHQGARPFELRARSCLERLLAERAQERSRNGRRARIRPENHGEARDDDRR